MAKKDSFPKRLRTLRKRRGMSQIALAELCGLSKNTIGQYERGEVLPSYDTLMEIAGYFGVTLDELCGRKNF